MTAHTSSDTPAIDSTMPTGSNRCTWVSRLVGTKRAINTMATSTTGTLTMNTDPHQKCSSSQPPVTGPSATLSPAVAAQIEMAAARSRGSGEDVDEQGERGGEDQRRTDAHQRPRADQLVGVGGEGAEPTEQPEPGHADQQRPFAAEAVAEAAGGEQETGEDERVGVDDPLQLGGGGAELTHERGQGDVDDRAVEGDDEHGEAEDAEHQPPTGRRGGRRVRPRRAGLDRAVAAAGLRWSRSRWAS